MRVRAGALPEVTASTSVFTATQETVTQSVAGEYVPTPMDYTLLIPQLVVITPSALDSPCSAAAGQSAAAIGIVVLWYQKVLGQSSQLGNFRVDENTGEFKRPASKRGAPRATIEEQSESTKDQEEEKAGLNSNWKSAVDPKLRYMLMSDDEMEGDAEMAEMVKRFRGSRGRKPLPWKSRKQAKSPRQEPGTDPSEL
ncbi:hypothetical protein CYMTET_45890 [Cymbomonas tetramitiformis]|uniref:Uncharacterized protein n=1 Tax=Cymbomonas tetramitiformis TaxID=36881 RepID=A0AAE0BXA2_9CHLO|nr:hypothetical protein CYMTET_45890 [Cymbomonas tetramitiformis]